MLNFLKREEFLKEAGLPLAVVRRAPQPPYPLHAHEFAELVVVYHGEGVHFTERGEREVKAGDVFLIHGKCRHGYRNLKDMDLINLIFLPEAIAGLGIFQTLQEHLPMPADNTGSLPTCHLQPHELEDVMAIIGQMEQEEKERRTASLTMITALFLRLVVMLLRRNELQLAEPEPQSRLRAVLRYIETHLQEEITLAQMARAGRMSISSLTREFKRLTGFSPVEYLINFRIRQAARLLLTAPEKSIAEAGDACGFADSNYFTRVFRKKTGKSPREFRKTGTWAD